VCDERSFAPLDPEIERVIREVIGAGLAVHRQLGPGFLEPIYERALAIELRYRNIAFDEQHRMAVRYRGDVIARHRLDLLVEHCVVVEVKAVKQLRPVHQAQLLSYLKASGLRVGLLMNFNVRLFKNGIRRFIR
jgi:GxxExxY protein